jgi:hypothetical protein
MVMWAYDIPWSVILDIVFLDFLDVMVGLWIVHAFCTKKKVSSCHTCHWTSRLTISMRNLLTDIKPARR